MGHSLSVDEIRRAWGTFPYEPGLPVQDRRIVKIVQYFKTLRSIPELLDLRSRLLDSLLLIEHMRGFDIFCVNLL